MGGFGDLIDAVIAFFVGVFAYFTIKSFMAGSITFDQTISDIARLAIPFEVTLIDIFGSGLIGVIILIIFVYFKSR